MTNEANARINGTSEVDQDRIAAQNEIKKLYYQDDNGEEKAWDLKEAIKGVLDEFAAGYEGRSFEDFADAEIAAADAIITD